MDTLESRISSARFVLSERIPFLGYVLMKAAITVTEDPAIPTACVDAKGNIRFNREFGDKLTLAQLTFVLAHEVLHPALGLFPRMRNRNHKLGNIAHDFVINDIIFLFGEEEKKNAPAGAPPLIDMPPGLLWDPALRDMSFEEVYDKILSEQKYQTMKFQSDLDMSQDPNDDKEKGGKGKGKGDGKEDGEGDGGGNPGEDDGGMDSEAAQEWKITVLEAQQVADRMSKDGRGYLPGGLKQIIDEIVAPKLDWKTLLSRWVGERGRKLDPSYRRPGRRTETLGEMMPSLFAIWPDIAILWDTSGSMMGEHKKICAEIADMLSHLGKVRIVSCDAAVHADIEASDIMEALEANVGGGGSDFNPAFQQLEDTGYRGPVIALTDGYIGVPEYQPEGLDVLWVLMEKGQNPPAPWGEALDIG